jgi:crossover junction endodeoxyribonuclease RuvC
MTDKTRVAVGIDPSLTNTAVCFYTPTQVTQPHTSCFSSKPQDGLARIRRFTDLSDDIVVACSEADPAIVFVEGYSFGSKGNAGRWLAEFGGILRCRLLATFGDAVVEVPPARLKKWATGRGNAKKLLVVAAIVKRYGAEYDTDDEYDAFALSRMAAQVLGWEEAATKFQANVVKDLRSRYLQDAEGWPLEEATKAPEHPYKTILREYKQRKMGLEKHQAANVATCSRIIEHLDSIGEIEAADWALWMIWWRLRDHNLQEHLVAEAREARDD